MASIKRNKKSKKKKNDTINWKAMIIDKLLIGAIIIGFTVYLQTCQSIKLAEIQKSNQIALDNLNHNHQVYLSVLEIDSKQQLQKREQEYQTFLSTFLKNEDLKNKIKELKIHFKQDSINIRKQFEHDSLQLLDEIKGDEQREIDKARLQYITSQLEEFYWPISIRLEKNNAVYDKLDDSFIGSDIDESVILPNHLEIVNILENKMYFAQADTAFLQEIAHYVGYVYTYQSLRKAGYTGLPEKYGGKTYRNEFYKTFKVRTIFLQAEYDSLIFKYDSVIFPVESLYSQFKDDLLKAPVYTPNLQLSKQEFEINLSYNQNSFVKSIGNLSDHTIISFEDYNDITNSCEFGIGTHDAGKWNFVNDPKPTYLNIREGQTKEHQTGFKNYRILLRKTWKEGRRRKALIQIESWKIEN